MSQVSVIPFNLVWCLGYVHNLVLFCMQWPADSATLLYLVYEDVELFVY